MSRRQRRFSRSALRAHLKLRAIQSGLSSREQEVVLLLAQGLSNRKIADECCVCEQTIKDHLKHIYLKLGVHQRVAVFSRLLDL